MLASNKSTKLATGTVALADDLVRKLREDVGKGEVDPKELDSTIKLLNLVQTAGLALQAAGVNTPGQAAPQFVSDIENEVVPGSLEEMQRAKKR